jgi:hypothetical protein
MIPLASVAFAQDAQPDGGAPVASSSSVPTTPPPPPPPTVTVVTKPPPTSTVSEQEPLRLGRFLQLEADRARAARYGNAGLGTLGGAIEVGFGIAAYAIVSSIPASEISDQPLFEVVAAIPIVFGGLQIVSSLFSLYTVTPMESLLDAYGPIAVDKNLTPAQRLGRGEGMLAAAADLDHRRRTVSAISSFVLAGLMAGLSIFFAVDTTDFPSPDGPLLSVSFAVTSLTTLFSGVGQLWWERGSAEIAWDQWRSSHEDVVVQVSRVHFAPMFAPTRGGATAGLSLRF